MMITGVFYWSHPYIFGENDLGIDISAVAPSYHMKIFEEGFDDSEKIGLEGRIRW